jgi:preprotein translocase subunit SecE
VGKISNFFRESIVELKKVVWPSKDSVASSTKVVLVSTLLFAIFFGVIDFLLVRGLYLFF